MAEYDWWKHGVIYQIYPRSFQDTNGDGVGDLRGITERLEHLEGLGVDAVWISPIYPSPMADFGYDISDYCDIDPLFGTLDDFDDLVTSLHGRNLKLILDYVPNHTSDRHPWFEESRSSRTNARRDWYIWRDPAPDGGPPNNWMSNFGGSAWEFDSHTGQYYYHAFLKEQPDLNWRNPAVREAMHEVLRFWMRRGVDGFRVDVMWHLIKDAAFRDDPPNPGYQEGRPDVQRVLQVNSADQPEVHQVVRELRQVVDEFDDRVLIGEIYLPIERLVAYYGANLEGAHLPFNFQLIHAAWNAPTLGRLIREYEAALPPGGWPNWVLGNHDQKRIASRVGKDQARVAAMLLLTLRGTPTLYYGDEIGMTNVPVPPDAAQDPWERNEPGLGVGRDPQRTPMQWDAGPQAGFSSSQPWLPVAEDYRSTNVQILQEVPGSLLKLHQDLIALRRQSVALQSGSFGLLHASGNILAYERQGSGERLAVVLNLGNQPEEFRIDPEAQVQLRLSTYPDRLSQQVGSVLHLEPNEGIVAQFI